MQALKLIIVSSTCSCWALDSNASATRQRLQLPQALMEALYSTAFTAFRSFAAEKRSKASAQRPPFSQALMATALATTSIRVSAIVGAVKATKLIQLPSYNPIHLSPPHSLHLRAAKILEELQCKAPVSPIDARIHGTGPCREHARPTP